MTSNIIVSSGGCFVLGLLLNRPKKTQQKPTSNPPTLPRTTPTRNPPVQNHPNANVLERYSPQRILDSVRSLRDSDRVGYVAAVQNLRMIDDYGSSWSIGVQSMNWYVSQNGMWVRGLPPSRMRVTAGGNIFLNRPPTQPTTETFTKTAAMRICPHCGAGNDASSLFCINCGHKVSAPTRPVAPPRPITRTCGRCGATVNPRRRFCTKCGNPLPAS